MSKHRTAAVAYAAVLLGALGGIGAPGALAAQEETAAPPAPASYDEQIDAFFARLAEGKGSEAIDGLYGETPLAAEIGDQLDELKAQLAEIPGVVGEYLGQERIGVQPLGERFVYAWHVAYFEKRPFQMHFSFYKPRERWLIFQFAFDQGIAGAARDLAKERLEQ